MSIVEAEEWRAIPGFPGYEASNLGRIRSLDRIVNGNPSQLCGERMRGRILKPAVNNCGYYRVCINRKMKSVHRLVASSFLGAIPPGMHINHMDGVKLNNRIDNLEIVTRLQNNHHARDLGLLNPAKGESHCRAKLTEKDVQSIRAITGRPNGVIAKEYGVSKTVIQCIRARKTWKHVL